MQHRENVIRVNVGEEETREFKDLPFMEKWRVFRKEKEESGHTGKLATRLMYVAIAFQGPSQLYFFPTYIIPAVFNDFDDWTQYCLKVFVSYIIIMCLANYFCVILYDTTFLKKKDRPNLVGLSQRWEHPPDHFVPYNHASENGYGIQHDSHDDDGMGWHYCDKCEMKVPPRTHHCKICKKCILKRDHHCFVVGTCVGFKNQRYFLVLCFYAVLCGLGCAYFTYSYLMLMYLPICYSWTDFLLPVAIYRWLFGTTNLTGHYIIIIYHVYFEILYGIFGMIYFTSQMVIIPKGITLHEFTKRIPVRNSNSINANFRSVFGDFWALNFLFPMQIILKQRDDGTKWDGVKLDYNANYQK